MIGSIEFFKLPGSLTTAEYPVLDSAGTSLTSYRVTNYSNSKFTKDFQQRITVPEFSDWTTCNLCRLTSGSWIGWYWITDRHTSSIVNGAIEFAIEYNAVTSKLTKTSSVSGYWTRAPSNIAPWRQQSPISGAMMIDTIHNFNNSIFTVSGVTYQLFWMQVTATKSLTLSTSSNRLSIYGFPVACNDNTKGYSLSGRTIQSNSEWIVSDTNTRFPTLESMLSDATQFGLSSAEEIIDISISPILPYDYQIRVVGTTPIFNLLTPDGNPIPAVAFNKADRRGAYETSTGGYKTLFWSNQYLGLTSKQLACGQIAVTAPNGSDIAQIPTQWAEEDGFYFTVECIPDYGQMTIRLDIGYRSYQMPTSHLPYLGSAWDSYKAYSQAFDRQSLEYSITSARDALNVQTNASVANGIIGAVGNVLSGNIGGALQSVAGQAVGVATSYKQQEISDKSARFNQDLTERRIQAQPATIYSTAYGITYVIDCLKRLPGFTVYMPVGLTDTIFNDYIARYGYSVEGKATLSIKNGFYQGQLLATASDSGGEFDRLNDVFMSGIHIRVIS